MCLSVSPFSLRHISASVFDPAAPVFGSSQTPVGPDLRRPSQGATFEVSLVPGRVWS